MDIAKRSAKGSLVLFGGNLIGTSIAAISSIIIARLLGPSDFGLFTLSLVTPSLLQLFTHFGTRTAVTKYVANYLALGDIERARRFAQSAMIFSIVAGGVFAVVNYFLAGWAAVTLFQRPNLEPYIALASVYLFGQSIGLVVIATATGWNSMGQAAFANVLQSVLKLVVSPALIILGFGVTGAVLGHSLSFLLGGLVSSMLLFFTRVKFVRERFNYLVEDTRELIRFGFQPFVGNLLGGLSAFYVSVLLALVATDTVVGYYGTATNLIVPASLLAGATASALYPAFASLHVMKADTAQAFAMSVKYVSYLIGPILFFLAAASHELMYVAYGNSYAQGSQYLTLLALANAPIIIGQSVIPSFLNGIGRPRLTFFALGASAIVLFAAAPLLAVVGGLGLNGLILALFISNSTVAAVGLYLVHHYRLGATGWRSAAATLAASLVALAACVVLPAIGRDLIMLAVKTLVFAVIYLTLAPSLGAVDLWDLDRLSESLSGIRFIGRIASPIIWYERAVIRKVRGQP